MSLGCVYGIDDGQCMMADGGGLQEHGTLVGLLQDELCAEVFVAEQARAVPTVCIFNLMVVRLATWQR